LFAILNQIDIFLVTAAGYFYHISADFKPLAVSFKKTYGQVSSIGYCVFIYFFNSNNGGFTYSLLGAGATSDKNDVDGKRELSGFGANRLLTTARLYKQTKLPIIVSDGAVFKDSGNEAEIAKRQLISIGIPENTIIFENKSLNTEQNAQFKKKVMDFKMFEHSILVTSAFHMERAVLNFTRVGIKVVPYPTDFQTNHNITIDPSKFVPADLRSARLALKEYLGILALKI
jgi:uncharacterized SAM-binding protein YcdF (DUF218 family)